jgi:hypothetical protein
MVSDLLVLDAVGVVVILGVLAYTAYWALVIRRSLMVQLFRRQALWTGAIAAIYTGLFSVAFTFLLIIHSSSSLLDFIVSVSQDIGIIMIFAWIDTSVKIARRSDPLLRDTLSWSKLRILLWTIIIGAFISTYYFSISSALAGGSLSNAPSLPLLISLVTALATPFVSGLVVLPISAARSKDPIFRRHLKWFSIFVIVLGTTVWLAVSAIFQGSVTGFIDIIEVIGKVPVLNEVTFLVIIIASCALYQSARSLAPINRLTLGEGPDP